MQEASASCTGVFSKSPLTSAPITVSLEAWTNYEKPISRHNSVSSLVADDPLTSLSIAHKYLKDSHSPGTDDIGGEMKNRDKKNRRKNREEARKASQKAREVCRSRLISPTQNSLSPDSLHSDSNNEKDNGLPRMRTDARSISPLTPRQLPSRVPSPSQNENPPRPLRNSSLDRLISTVKTRLNHEKERGSTSSLHDMKMPHANFSRPKGTKRGSDNSNAGPAKKPTIADPAPPPSAPNAKPLPVTNKYRPSDPPPYCVHIQHNDGVNVPLHAMMIGKYINTVVRSNIRAISQIGRGKIIAEFATA